jgi:dihydrofolate reductase
MDLAIIAAVSENGVIGAAGGLPWHYPEDLRYFKQVTTGHPVLMGRRTYESIVDRLDEPLPDRTNVVMTRGEYQPDNEGVVVTGSLDEAIDAATGTGAETAYVIGGASIFRQTLEQGLADRLVITHIPDTYEGDTYWPGSGFADLAVVDRTPLGDELEAVTYDLHGQQ